MILDLILIGAVSFFGAISLLIWLELRSKKKTEKNLGGDITKLNDLMIDLRANTKERLQQASTFQEKQTQETVKMKEDLAVRLAELKKESEQMLNIADQVGNLERVLSNPKQRGVLGEYYLESVLANVLPPNVYKTQYTFKEGTLRVDAVIVLQEGILPIDSKFSLENYQRMLDATGEERMKYESLLQSDLKKRIDESAKYILPNEGTTEFVFMFIPSETLYYDLLSNSIGSGSTERTMIEYAAEKKVVIVSPTTLFAYLQTVLQGLKALHIEKQAQEIVKRLGVLHKQSKKSAEAFDKMGKSLSTAVGHYNDTAKALTSVSKNILTITSQESLPEAHKQIDKPDFS